MARRLGPQCHNPQCQLGQVLTLNRVTKHANGEGRPVHGEDKACLLPQLTASLRGQGHRPDHSAQDTGRHEVRPTHVAFPGLCAAALQECRAILGLTRPLSTGSMQGEEGRGEGVSQGLGHGSPGSGCL